MSIKELQKSTKEQIKSGMDSAEIVRGLINQGLDKRQALEMVESASNELLRSPQITDSNNWWFPVALGGIAAATVGGLIWTLVVVLTQYELGPVAWGIGALCGLVVTLLSKDRKGLTVQLIAAGSCVLGILIGKYGTFYYFVKESLTAERGEEAVRDLSWFSPQLFEAFVAQIHKLIKADDIIWIILAVITAWNMPNRSNLFTAKKKEADFPPDDRNQEEKKWRNDDMMFLNANDTVSRSTNNKDKPPTNPSGLCLLFFWLVLPVFAACGGNDNHKIPKFERSSCEFPLHSSQKEGSTVTCGYLVVRENRSKPNSPTIKLHVARFHGENRSASPLVYLVGGPGGSVYDMSAYISTSVVDIIAYPGDFIIFDQRGVGKSEPSLYCHEVDQAFDDLASDATPEEQKDVTVSSLLDCSDRLTSTGVDLSAYNTVENAADVNDLRIAFGYSTINLWGGSYGSRLALEIIRNHSTGLRSAVIEAIVPPQAPWSFEVGMNFENSLSRLFEACENDTACNNNFGDLNITLANTYTNLNQEPLIFPPHPEKLTGYTLVSIIFSLMYVAETYPYIPRLIQAAHDRNLSEVENILGDLNAILESGELYWGMHASVVCQDHVRYLQAADLDLAHQNLRDEIKDVFFPYAETFFELCKDWPTGAAIPNIMDPVSSNVPTLIMSGEFDPITPARYGELVSETLSQSQSFEYPNTGHGNSHDCALDMMLYFLAAPTSTLDASCINDIEPISFMEPAFYRSTVLKPNNFQLPSMPYRPRIR